MKLEEKNENTVARGKSAVKAEDIEKRTEGETIMSVEKEKMEIDVMEIEKTKESEVQTKDIEIIGKDDELESDEDDVCDNNGIYALLEEEINGMDADDKEKKKRIKKLKKIRKQKVNIMLVGSTGSGKSSTINSLFDMKIATVGEGVDPETQAITEFKLANLTVWDTPGLGDGVDRDEEIADEILLKLQEKDENGNQLIDMVVMIMDASSKDLTNYYNIINNILKPEFGSNAAKRILIALNQSDLAMKGTHWDAEKNMPDTVLEDFLKKKAESVQVRIKENTDLDISPICYCAGYTEDGIQRKPYNLTKLLYYIVRAVPKAKKLNIAENLNKDKDNWTFNDMEFSYSGSLKREFGEIIMDCVSDGIETGADLGTDILGIPGTIIGGVIGGVLGGIGGFFEAICS